MTTSFKIADADITFVAQGPNLKSVGNKLTRDLGRLEEYSLKWKLRPNPNKTAVCTHHLDSRIVNAEVDVTFCGTKVENVRSPKYLGVTFDRTLNFKEYLQRCKDKEGQGMGKPHPETGRNIVGSRR